MQLATAEIRITKLETELARVRSVLAAVQASHAEVQALLMAELARPAISEARL
jgi:hypothetical protein